MGSNRHVSQHDTVGSSLGHATSVTQGSSKTASASSHQTTPEEESLRKLVVDLASALEEVKSQVHELRRDLRVMQEKMPESGNRITTFVGSEASPRGNPLIGCGGVCLPNCAQQRKTIVVERH